MKKLIALLSAITICTSSSLSLISCSDENKTKKQKHKKHLTKDEENDNEENEDNEVAIDDIMEKLQDLKILAKSKANKTNTIAELINELNNRKEIKSIVKDYDFKISSTLDFQTILEQQMYEFNISIETDDEEENSVVFKVVVKEEAIDLEQQKYMRILNETSSLVEESLAHIFLIADGTKTFKDIKEKINTTLNNVVQNKEISLDLEFNNSIFTSDEQIVYKTDTPAFEIKFVLLCKDNNQFSLSKTFNSILINGLTKEQIEGNKTNNSQYEADKNLLTQLLNDQSFKDKLSSLTGIKANEKNTIKDLLNELRKLQDTVFDSENLKKYKYNYFSLEQNTDQILDADKPVNLKITTSDEKSSDVKPFFEQEFELKIIEETSPEKFIRVANMFKQQLENHNNAEFDFSKIEELQADGKRTWGQLFNKLSNKEDFKKYFNLNNLINIIKNIKLVDFSFSLDPSENLTEQNLLTNLENKYINVNLKMLPTDNEIDKANLISTKLKFKIGGLSQQEIDKKEFTQVASLIKDQLENHDYDLSDYDELKNNKEMTLTQLFNKLSNKDKFKKYFNLNNLNDKDMSLVNFSFTVDNDIVLELEKYVTINLKISPEKENVDKNNEILTKLKIKINWSEYFKNVNEIKKEIEYFTPILYVTSSEADSLITFINEIQSLNKNSSVEIKGEDEDAHNELANWNIEDTIQSIEEYIYGKNHNEGVLEHINTICQTNSVENIKTVFTILKKMTSNFSLETSLEEKDFFVFAKFTTKDSNPITFKILLGKFNIDDAYTDLLEDIIFCLNKGK